MRPMAALLPPAELMATPAEFALPPVTIYPATGKPVMTGRDALPAIIDILKTGGDIRMQLLRLQAWVRETQPTPAPAD